MGTQRNISCFRRWLNQSNQSNRTSRTPQPSGTASNYTYDPIYELTQVTQGGSTTESYSYDPVGNRLSSLGVSSYTNNSSNELTSTSNATYTYDYNGNLLTKVVGSNTTTNAWDYENRLTSVTLPGSGGTVTFKYDPFGRRIYKSSSSGTSIYAYDGDNLIEETNSSGTAVARYSQGLNIDEPLAMLRGGATSFYHADGLGSVTSLSSSAGSIANTYTYDSFGNLTASTGSITNPFRYTAREFDTETSLYYYRARYYDLTTGRFIAEDPIGFDSGGNFYRYAYNSPTGLSDPTGLSPADVGRIQADCKRCTQELTDQGRRLPGEGKWGGFRNDNKVLGGILNGLLHHGDPRNSGKLEGCKSQAGLAKGCLTNDPTLSGWTFSEEPWWLGSHTVNKGQSSDPNDPIVYSDPWRNYTWTAPRNPDHWPRYSKF